MKRAPGYLAGVGMLLSALCFATPVIAQKNGSSMPIQPKERAALFPARDSIEQGKAIAEANCATCHGVNGISSDAGRPHLAGQRTIYLYREMLAYKAGWRKNDAMRNAVEFLDSDALLTSAIYYASLATPFSRDVVESKHQLALDDDPLISVKAATAGCGSCHGVSGNSGIPGMPSLTSQHPDYFTESMKAYQSGDRTDNMMQMLVSALDEETIEKMGLYYALQTPAKTAMSITGDAGAGQATADRDCASCHGTDGNTTSTDMPSLAGQDPVYFVKALKAYVNGQRTHAAMESAVAGLGDQSFNNLAAFYAAQEPVARRVRKPLNAAEWVNRCDRCHGAGGNSTDPRYSRLAGQNRQYLVDVLQAYADGERVDSVMHAMSEPLDRGVIERLATYYSTQEPRSVVYFELPCNGEENP